MNLLFIVGCIVVTILTIYNVICYKNKKTVYMLNDKYIILNTKYYKTQFIFGVINSFSLLIFCLVWNKTSKNPSIFTVISLAIFWGLNYILTLYARKKCYIVTKKQS